jgi:hypothetical protein
MILKRLAPILLLLTGFSSPPVLAACQVVEGAKRAPFDGKSLDRISVEKKSLTLLNEEYPNLNAIEMTFKGELQTCTSCTEKHIECKAD